MFLNVAKLHLTVTESCALLVYCFRATVSKYLFLSIVWYLKNITGTIKMERNHNRFMQCILMKFIQHFLFGMLSVLVKSDNHHQDTSYPT